MLSVLIPSSLPITYSSELSNNINGWLRIFLFLDLITLTPSSIKNSYKITSLNQCSKVWLYTSSFYKMTEDYLKFQNFGNKESRRDHYIAYPSLEITTITTNQKKKKKRERERRLFYKKIFNFFLTLFHDLNFQTLNIFELSLEIGIVKRSIYFTNILKNLYKDI